MKRSESREAAFILLFENTFRNESPDEIIESAMEADLFEISDDAIEIFKSVWAKKSELDVIIEQYSEKRMLSRIPKVSLAILEIAMYESIYSDKVPVNAAISEAVILSKKFGMEPDVQFVNGVLGAFSTTLKKD